LNIKREEGEKRRETESKEQYKEKRVHQTRNKKKKTIID
jgi:hypothetical protein